MAVNFTFACPLANGFHARPASHLAAAANNYTSDCTLTNQRNGSVADMKSVLSIIAADIRLNDECSVGIDGVDEEAACAELRRFLEKDLAVHDVPLPDLSKEAKMRELPRALRSARAQACFGLAAGRGIGEGRTVVIGAIELTAEAPSAKPTDPAQEEQKIQRAIAAVGSRIQTRLLEQPQATESAILQAHLAMLTDKALLATMLEHAAQGKSATQAIAEASSFFGSQLRRSESSYMRERAIDIQGLCLELVENISDTKPKTSAKLTEPSVLIAENLTPQQLLALERKWVRGLVLESAGTTSHTVILARSLGIPTLAGVKGAHLVASGQEVLVDANRGFLITECTPNVRKFYERESRTLERRKAVLARHGQNPGRTGDGHAFGVCANVSTAEESTTAFEAGADGIGVFRTEMLFLGSEQAPSEDEQLEVYARAARAAQNKPVIIRTIDIGGDKPLPFLKLPDEDNPFLGYRGVRVYKEHRHLVRTQISAALRASSFGRIHLMVPMVSTLEEVLWFKNEVAEVQKDLKARKLPSDQSMPLGMMIEVPSVAFILDQLCAEVDFFSIGTNDLSQYFFAADRGNPKVASLANVRHPGFLRFLQQIVSGIHKREKSASVCGDMAADPPNLALLVGLGVDEISVPVSEIISIKEKIAQLCVPDCQKLFAEALGCRQTEDVERLLDRESVNAAKSLMDRELILVGHGITSKEDAIREIVDAFYVAGRTEDPDRLEEAVWTRESVYSTGLGHGFAVPHCKTDAINSGSIGVLKLKEPVDWGSLDGHRVEIVILLAARESDAGNEHLRVFSRLARNLMDDEFRERLLKAADADAILAVLNTVAEKQSA